MPLESRNKQWRKPINMANEIILDKYYQIACKH